jgi:hypothetical protein
MRKKRHRAGGCRADVGSCRPPVKQRFILRDRTREVVRCRRRRTRQQLTVHAPRQNAHERDRFALAFKDAAVQRRGRAKRTRIETTHSAPCCAAWRCTMLDALRTCGGDAPGEPHPAGAIAVTLHKAERGKMPPYEKCAAILRKATQHALCGLGYLEIRRGRTSQWSRLGWRTSTRREHRRLVYGAKLRGLSRAELQLLPTAHAR